MAKDTLAKQLLLELGYPKDKIQKEGLDLKIGPGFDELSAGQKQAICLVREILNKKRLVILDEATSNFDSSNEKEFQKVLFREFSGSTMLIISHRLPFVLQCDKVMRIQDGILMEMDSPKNLLLDSSSLQCNLSSLGK